MDTARSRCLLALAGGLLVGTLGGVDAQTPAGPKTLALVGGRILTQTDAGIIEGTIVLRDGKIVAVGPKVSIPAGAERIDVTGLVVTPGLIDAHGALWMQPAAVTEGAADGGLDVLDGVDPHGEDWKEVARQGVTAVYVQPGNSGMLSGRGALLRVAPAETIAELVLQAGVSAQAALGIPALVATPTVPTGLGRRGGVAPPDPSPTPPRQETTLSRFGQYEQLKRTLEGFRSSGRGSAGAIARPDATRDFLQKVARGEVPLRLEAHHEDDVRNALRLADELKLRVVLEGLSNPHGAGADLVRRRWPLVLGPIVELEEVPAYRRGRAADWPRALVTPDTRWALGTFSTQPRGSRLLRVQAAAAVARGIDPDHVLRALTCDAAAILGVGDRLGTIAPGKQADLAVFAGDPLDPSVAVRLVVSGGKVVYRADSPAAAERTEPARPTSPLPLPTRLPKKYALKTQRLLMEDGTYRRGVVLIENGKITAVDLPRTASDAFPSYDLGTAVLAPGLVVGHSPLGMSAAIDDPAEADAGQVRAADVYDPRQPLIRELCAGGFTSALYAPGSANVIAGTMAGVRFGAADAVQGDAGVKFVLTSNSRGTSRGGDGADAVPAGRRGASGPARYPGSLAGQVELIEQVLNGQAPPTELYLPPAVRAQIQAERQRSVTALRERKQVAFFEVHTRAEVDAALQLIGRFQLRGVLVGPDEIQPFVDEMKRLGVAIVARPLRADDFDRLLRELAEAARAGVPVAFGSGSAPEMRIAAALAINAGMPRLAAWRGLTTVAAQLGGLPAGVGQLAVGSPADLVIWDGSPLDVRSRPLRVVVAGQCYVGR